MAELNTGTRLRCDECKSEVIVLTGADAELTCCGSPLTVMSAGTPRG
jgi:hypothetical protein